MPYGVVYLQDDAKTPEITTFVIGPSPIQPHIYHFWGHEVCWTDLQTSAFISTYNLLTAIQYCCLSYIICMLSQCNIMTVRWQSWLCHTVQKHRHDLPSSITARCQQRRLASMCGPVCL